MSIKRIIIEFYVLPFHGEDVWTAYEVSWLDAGGKPAVAIATLRVPAASSPCIVESKSVKLYLTAFNQTRFGSPAEVETTLRSDLATATGAPVEVGTLTLPSRFSTLLRAEPEGVCLDDLPLAATDATPVPAALAAAGVAVEETLFTRLFRSLCPVTGQPDYATVLVTYRGPAIDRAGLLRYFVSWRRHAGFHEHCVESIFMDVWRRCGPATLRVHARLHPAGWHRHQSLAQQCARIRACQRPYCPAVNRHTRPSGRRGRKHGAGGGGPLR